MPEKNKYVLDSYALIGYLENEPFSREIEGLLKSARKGKAQLFLHAIHLGEVYYITFREQGEKMADISYSRIRAFPLNFIDTISEELLLKAASLKAKYTISYAYSFAAALSMLNNCLLLSGDPEYKELENGNCVLVEDEDEDETETEINHKSNKIKD